MRSTILFLAVLALCLSGCCGTDAVGVQSGPTAPRAAAMASTTTHAGCTLSGGLECGGESLFGLKVDLPDLRPLIKAVGPLLPSPSAQAAPAQSQQGAWVWDPSATTYADPGCGE